MNVYLYQADLFCEDCGKKIIRELTLAGNAPSNPRNESSYDSDDFPKGPYPAGGGESDCPQHCGNGERCVNALCFHCPTCNPNDHKVGCWLENDLTTDGIEYVRKAIIQGGPVSEYWQKVYADYSEISPLTFLNNVVNLF